MYKNQEFMLEWHYISTSHIHQQDGQFFTATQHHISEDCKTGSPCFMPHYSITSQKTARQAALVLCPTTASHLRRLQDR